MTNRCRQDFINLKRPWSDRVFFKNQAPRKNGCKVRRYQSFGILTAKSFGILAAIRKFFLGS